jgi:preprotein translocase subunit SecA
MSDLAHRSALPMRPNRAPASQKAAHSVDGLDAWFFAQRSRMAAPLRRRAAMQAAAKAAELEPRFWDFSQAALLGRGRELGLMLRRHGLMRPVVIEAMALAREQARRSIGMVPFVQQLAGGYALLFDAAVEMETGEGKTLTTLIPGVIRALSGRMVHVVTANDYLAERDGTLLRPAFEALGISVGIVTHNVPLPQRRAAYACNVVFVSNKEVAFDYLRDGLIAPRQPGLAGIARKTQRVLGRDVASAEPVIGLLDVAIVDELDSVLIDDAGTPLVISTTMSGALDDATAQRAFEIAGILRKDEHFELDAHGMHSELLPAGIDQITHMTKDQGGMWQQRIRREELIREALTARHLLKRDLHYLVEDGKVIMIDTYSGRRMPDRYWGQDLHRLIELKEGCSASGTRKSLASTSFQRFFRSYANLSGMSGTVSEVAAELARVYGLNLVRIPRRLACQRRRLPRRIFLNRAALWEAVARHVGELHTKGEPVLIGVRTVLEAERGADALRRQGIPHAVLSAAHDNEEAAIVARTGLNGTVTIATNMAGRGTDIRLGEGVADLGGLVVMLCERHDSRRVDRQLMGRCARQGDPGLVIEYVSAEDILLEKLPLSLRRVIADGALSSFLTAAIFRLAQFKSEWVLAARRIDLVRRDVRLSQFLAFAGGLD